MKKIITILTVGALSLTMATSVFAKTTVVNPTVTLISNSEKAEKLEFENDIINVDGTNFFPMRELLNELGVENEDIIWNESAKSVNFSEDYFNCTFVIGEDKFTQNGKSYDTVEPFIYNNKTYLPIRYVANSLGYVVNYDNETKETVLTHVNIVYDIPLDKEDLPQLSKMTKDETIAKIETNYGDITVRLFPEEAPLAVKNFVTLSMDGYYDGLTFHRVIEDFVIQGGDPKGTGTGGESIYGEPFENEVSNKLHHFNGALAMANAGPDTNGSQFYFVTNDELTDDILNQLEEVEDNLYTADEEELIAKYFPQVVLDAYRELGGLPYLDYNYTVFGQVVEGMDVIKKISEVETDNMDKPVEPVTIKSISIKQTK